MIPTRKDARRGSAEFRDRVALAKQLGCDCVGLWPGGGLRGQTIDQAIERLAGTFREAGRIAGDAGLLACFEIEPPFVFNKEDHYLRILHGANHPALKGIYDPSHFDLMTGSTGKPEEMLRRVGVQNIGYVQFCDTDGTLRDGGTIQAPGVRRRPRGLREVFETSKGWRLSWLDYGGRLGGAGSLRRLHQVQARD